MLPRGPQDARFTLPRDVAGFTGRTEQIARIEKEVGSAPLPPILVISDGPGKGKTALAIHVAHRLAERFPDAQLHLCLGGEELPELTAAEALGSLLWALGVDRADLPSNVDDRAALWRSQLRDSRALIVLDNAMSVRQVEPLLPASPGCAVLITTRYALTDLEGTRAMSLHRLADAEAAALLESLVGAERAVAEPEAVRLIVELCGGLPLALQVVGSQLRRPARSRMALADFASRLADENTRLSLLRTRDREVRASFALSYQVLSDEARLVFRRLSLLRVPSFEPGLQEALVGDDPTDGCEELLDAHLVEPAGVDRISFHDLIRLYARGCADEEDTADEREAALNRAYAWCFAQARVWQDDLVRMDAERPLLTDVVRQAAETGRHDVAAGLAALLTPLLEAHNLWAEWLELDELVVESAAALGDRAALGQALNDLAHVYRLVRRTSEAAGTARRAVAECRAAADDRATAAALVQLGIIHREMHRYQGAVDHLGEARDILHALGDRAGEGSVLKDLAHALLWQRRPVESAETLRKAVELLADSSDRTNLAWAYANLVSAYGYMWQEAEALEAYENARRVFTEQDNRQGNAWADNHVGIVHRQAGRLAEAESCHRAALETFRELDDGYGIGWALLYLGLVRRDASLIEDARASFDRIGEANGHAWTLVWTAELTEDPALIPSAVAEFEEIDNPQGIGTALSVQGDLLLADGDRDGALRAYEASLPYLRRAHDTHREADSLRGLARTKD
ncbi:tetratricopeptide repeat protein [Actinomadura harenae]|nr:tetratricopeptide repeat protein [Actinomadura harenae]